MSDSSHRQLPSDWSARCRVRRVGESERERERERGWVYGYTSGQVKFAVRYGRSCDHKGNPGGTVKSSIRACVCLGEREREREREAQGWPHQVTAENGERKHWSDKKLKDNIEGNSRFMELNFIQQHLLSYSLSAVKCALLSLFWCIAYRVKCNFSTFFK